MTHRERMEGKLQKRLEWAGKAEARSDAASAQSHSMISAIPFGQPILVGHHSEGRDRRYRERAWNLLGRSVEQQKLAEHHEACAAGIEAALDRSIFSDDGDAIEQLELRIAEHEAKRERMKLVNKLYKKGDAAGLLALGLDIAALKERLAKAGPYWGDRPHLAYELSNLGGRITADRKRLEFLKAQHARAERAEAAPAGVTVEESNGGYCRVTFAEKPAREVLDALKAAGFFWMKGSWGGKRESLPASVTAMLTGEVVA